ncbi:hypothetical protein [Spirillospora sp. CA-294931]|uniref:hypothetical protein n=1 Tax=Spirillospora sp. CA-294931 TaxID=3240042 RepID=UPI003D91B4B6
MPRLILLGVGTAGSTRFAPAGLLVEYGHTHVGIDGGPGSEPPETVEAWLVRDEHDPLLPELRRIARESVMAEPGLGAFAHGALHVEPREAGYRITIGHRSAVWAPEPGPLPPWAGDADLAFAGAVTAADVVEGARTARELGVKRLVFARVGDALDRGEPPASGEWGEEGRVYRI